MINFSDSTKENIKKHKPNWQQIPDHSYRTLTIRGSWSRKSNWLFNLISQRPAIDTFLYAEGPYEGKYQFLIKKQEGGSLKHYNNSKAFI